MPVRLSQPVLALLLATAPVAPGAAPPSAEVTIYRCTDAAGKLSLRDTPCARGQAQEVRSMLRPTDAPPRPAATDVAPPAASPPPPQMMVRNAPRPLYECVRPDGSVYTADTAAGAPRWVPLWTLDVPVGGHLLPRPRQAATLPSPHAGSGGVRPPRPRHQPMLQPHAARAYRGAYPYGGGYTWVQDECHPLPQAEVCARLVDRRDEVRRRFFNAMPSERATLDVEERGINARLADDCGTR